MHPIICHGVFVTNTLNSDSFETAVFNFSAKRTIYFTRVPREIESRFVNKLETMVVHNNPIKILRYLTASSDTMPITRT
mgnify:CR=1 FL=1